MNNRGKIAELKACNYLRKKGYKIIDYNYQTRFGEIDIIVEDKKYIAFVEVKMRKNDDFGKPREFVDYSKQQKLIATARMYLSQHKTKKQPRFDVIEIFCDNYDIKSIKHLENAFELV